MSRPRKAIPDYRRDPAAPLEARLGDVLAVEVADHEDGTTGRLLWLDLGGPEATRIVLSAADARRLLEGLRALDDEPA